MTTRYAVTTDGQPACPSCLAHGIETVTDDARCDDRAYSLDDGCTDPLVGILCDECSAQQVQDDGR